MDSTTLVLVVLAGLALLVGAVRWLVGAIGGGFLGGDPLDSPWRELLIPALVAAMVALLVIARFVESDFWQQFVVDSAAGVGVFVVASGIRIEKHARLALLLAPLSLVLLVTALAFQRHEYASSLIRSLALGIALFLALEVVVTDQLRTLARARARRDRSAAFAPIAFESAMPFTALGTQRRPVSLPIATAAGWEVRATVGADPDYGYRALELTRPDVSVEMFGGVRVKSQLRGSRHPYLHGSFTHDDEVLLSAGECRAVLGDAVLAEMRRTFDDLLKRDPPGPAT